MSAPIYGRRLIPHVVDDNARERPYSEVYSAPRSTDPKDGWKIVTWKEYANAINYVARRILDTCGTPAPKTFPTIAYIGPNDCRYYILVVAAIKAGYKALFVSPRNSHEGQMNLFEATDCNIICFPKANRALVQPWAEERNMKAIEVGEAESWFPKEQVEPVPYNATWEDSRWDPMFVLHTSGSTGLPKPINVKHGMMCISDDYQNFPTWNGLEIWMKAFSDRSKRFFMPMPMFHAAGMYFFVIMSIYWSLPLALPVPDKPLTGANGMEWLANSGADSCCFPPAILEEMSQSPDTIEALSKVNMVAFGGGNLVAEAGDRLRKAGVRLINLIASTEAMPFPIYWQPNPDLWRYFIYNSEIIGYDWQKMDGVDGEAVYKQVCKRKDPKEPGVQGFFYTFPEKTEYDTGDMYRPHPTLPNHWLYFGRSDNVIVFSNGEKLNPVTIEEIVTDHASLKGAVVFGANRFQPGLLLEPIVAPKSDEEAEALIDDVWPLVVRANKETVAHGQISRQFIMLTKADKPLPRAGKGTIQRAMALNLYKGEMDELYEKAGEVFAASAPRLNLDSEDALIESLENIFTTHLGAPADSMDPDSDFFSMGVDSMQVINASRILKGGLAAGGHHVDASALATRVIYANPTPRRLAQYILSIVKGGPDATGNAATNGGEAHDVQAMKSLWQKYTQDLPQGASNRSPAQATGQTVVLTGSTGMLGSYMLDQLLGDKTTVAKVVCLNRAADGGIAQQRKQMAERGLADPDAAVADGRVEFHQVAIDRSDLGLPREVYEGLLSRMDRFVHNAWPVNFNLDIESFEPFLRGVRNVADLATASAKKVAVTFISSIGTADKWRALSYEGKVPEERTEDLRLPSGGYGQSKMVGGLILEDAAKVGGFSASVIRVGQIAGPSQHGEKGFWNKQEWLPSIVASSVYLGALPGEIGAMDRVDWTPVENIGALVLEVTGASSAVKGGAASEGYYNGVNPSSTSWGELSGAVQEFYGKEKIPKITKTFNDWVDLLEESSRTNNAAADLSKNPGVKLIDSYRGMAAGAGEPVVYNMEKTVKASPAMASATVVTPELMKLWCKQWGFA